MPGLTSLHAVLETLRRSEQPMLVLRPEPPPPEPRSVALLSGSFDPMTVAHAALAEAAASRADLVVLTYSVRTLAKEGEGPGSLLPEKVRIAALDAYCRARRGMAVGLCSHGLLADQTAACRSRFRASRLSLVMGSDKLLQLFDPRWYQDRDSTLSGLFAEAEVTYAVRAGEEGAVADLLAAEDVARWRDRLVRLDVPPDLAAVSSRRVRDLLARGESVDHLVPSEVRAILSRGE